MRASIVARTLQEQRGFTLTELLAVLAILGILAGLVGGAIRGLGEQGENARFAGDRVTIETGETRFFVESQPNLFPVVFFEDTPDFLKRGDQGVRLIDFDARLPQDPDQTFVPEFIKVVPDSAAIVSWRIDTNTGIVFFAKDAAPLIPPAAPRLNVSAEDGTPGEASDYTLTLKQFKSHSAMALLTVDLPAGYDVTVDGISDGELVGELTGTFAGNNDFAPKKTIVFDGELVSTGTAGEWELTIFYSDAEVVDGDDVTVKDGEDRTHRVTVVPPIRNIPGQIRIEFDQGTDPEQNEGTETWSLTIFGEADDVTIIENPTESAVYRWLAKGRSIIDIDVFKAAIAGNQAIIIKEPVTP